MKKIILITPVYNDWESFNKLLNEISLTVENLHNVAFQLIVINDGSTMLTPKINIPKNMKIKIYMSQSVRMELDFIDIIQK